jgi:multidrug transporter EmrE-like cation transporter
MTWILLAIAIGAEIVGTLLLKLSDGFTKLLWPSVGVVLGYLTAFALLSQSLKKIDVGIHICDLVRIWNYWGCNVGGAIFFNQELNQIKHHWHVNHYCWSSNHESWGS